MQKTLFIAQGRIFVRTAVRLNGKGGEKYDTKIHS